MSDFVPGLEGVIAFETAIAEPDREGGSLRYRGVDIEDLVGRVSFGNVWGLLVDNEFNPGLPPAEPFPLPVRTGDVRVDVQSALAQLAPVWGFRPLLDIDAEQAREDLARASVMALSFVAQSARGMDQPMVPQREVDRAKTIVERFMIRWRGEPDPKHVEALDAYWVSAAEHGMNASTFTARVIAGHRRGRRGLPVRRGRSDERPAARRRAGPGAAHDRGRGADRRRRCLRAGGARPRRAADGLRPPGLPGRGPAGPRCCGRPPSGSARRATRSAHALEDAALGELHARRPGPGARHERRVLGGRHPGLRPGARAMFAPMFTCARTAGWAAHILEHKRTSRLVRPSARYVGRSPAGSRTSRAGTSPRQGHGRLIGPTSGRTGPPA